MTKIEQETSLTLHGVVASQMTTGNELVAGRAGISPPSLANSINQRYQRLNAVLTEALMIAEEIEQILDMSLSDTHPQIDIQNGNGMGSDEQNNEMSKQ